MFQNEAQKKSKKISVSILLCSLVAVMGAVVWFIMDSKQEKRAASAVDSVEKTESKAATEEKTPVEDPVITLAFSGDTMFDWDLRPIVAEKGAEYPFQFVKAQIENADYAFTNIETALTERSEKTAGQKFWIKSEPSTIEAIKNTGFDIVSLGNNHALDYGREGLLDSISYTEAAGLQYIGAGRNAADAYTAREVMLKGKKFKFLSFVRFMPDGNWVATEDEPGVTNGYDINTITRTIQEQKGDADYLIVYMHWGIEKTNTPAAYQKEYVAKMTEAGADAIVGSHPHWLQGFEYYNGVPVAYSLGNFLFPDYVSGHSAETGILTLTCKGDNIQMAFTPYVIHSNQIQPLQDGQKQVMYQYLQTISYDVEITADGSIIDKRSRLQ